MTVLNFGINSLLRFDTLPPYTVSMYVLLVKIFWHFAAIHFVVTNVPQYSHRIYATSATLSCDWLMHVWNVFRDWLFSVWNVFDDWLLCVKRVLWLAVECMKLSWLAVQCTGGSRGGGAIRPWPPHVVCQWDLPPPSRQRFCMGKLD